MIEITQAELDHIRDVKRIFGTPEGGRVLAWLETEFATRTSFDPHSDRRTAFLEGQRHVIETMRYRLSVKETDIKVQDAPARGPLVDPLTFAIIHEGDAYAR